MQLHEVLGDCQTQSQPRPAASAHALPALAKAIKNERQELQVDTFARVPHVHYELIVRAGHGYTDLTARRRELDRVRYQIPEHLLQPVRIGRDANPVVIEAGRDANRLGLGCR